MVKMTWNFSCMDDLNASVNAGLRSTMFNERCRRWEKVIEGYRHLLWMIDKKYLPEDYEPPASFQMFIYEIYYHLGVAYQHVGRHDHAIAEFSNAVDIVSIPKNGCLAGCVIGSCLMTPLYARRAFAYTKTGDFVSAMRDAEKTVVLDNRNPDAYCIRALVQSAHNCEKQAVKDLDLALRFNSSHTSTLMLRKTLTQPQISAFQQRQQILKHGTLPNSYMNVTGFDHPCMIEFFDKMLFALSVPHTITQIDLTPDKPSKKSMDYEAQNKTRSNGTRPSSSHCQPEPFRCGSPMTSEQCGRSSLRRRKDYGAALQKYLCRPKTAVDFLAQLERDRRCKAIKEDLTKRRAASADTRSRDHTSSKITSRGGKDLDDTTTSDTSYNPLKKQAFIMKMPTAYTIPVFQATNIKEAPRMYYKPWLGDKLPVTQMTRRRPTPAFY